MLHYKDFKAILEVDDKKDIIVGRILNNFYLTTFQGITVREAKEAFRKAVDRHIDFCNRTNQKAIEPYAGLKHIKVTFDKYQEMHEAAKAEGKTVHDWATEILLKKAKELV